MLVAVPSLRHRQNVRYKTNCQNWTAIIHTTKTELKTAVETSALNSSTKPEKTGDILSYNYKIGKEAEEMKLNSTLNSLFLDNESRIN